jgi:hypothetical protein
VSKIDPLQLVVMRCLLRFEANGGGNTMVKKESRSIVRHSKTFLIDVAVESRAAVRAVFLDGQRSSPKQRP